MLSNRSSGLLGMAADPGLVSLLASMEPKQRQHYVAQHSDDINVVIMGKVVSDIANKLDIAKKGGQPGTKPTVLAQTIAAIAPEPQVQPQVQPQAQPQPQGQQQVIPLQGETQMGADGGYMDSRLPEDMGIGALPERSLSGMADGGIVGFSGAAESLVRSHTGGKDYFLDIPETVRDPSVPYYRMIPNPLASLAGRKFGSYDEAVQAYDNALYDPAMATRRDQYTNKNTGSDAPNATPSIATMPTDATRRGDVRFPVAGAAPPAAARPTGVPPAAGAPSAAPPSAKATGIQTLVTKDATVQDIVNARKDIAFLQDPVVDPLKAERQALVDERNKNAEAELTGFKERMAKQGDPYAKQEERANKQEASIAESEERSPYLALMEAGFAAMAGDSPYAMVNLGKGALAGTKTYREGLAQLEKAKEKLSETRDRIDGLRLIRSDLNDKEERDIKRDINKTALEGKTIMFSALEKLTGENKAQIESTLNIFMNAETARRLAERNSELERYRQGEETKRAELNARTQTGIAAANRDMQKTIAEMLPGDSRAAMLLGTGKTDQERLESGLQKAQEISGNPKLIIEAYTKHFKEMTEALKTPMSAEEFAAHIRALLAAMKNKGRLLNPQDEALVNKYAPKQ